MGKKPNAQKDANHVIRLIHQYANNALLGISKIIIIVKDVGLTAWSVLQLLHALNVPEILIVKVMEHVLNAKDNAENAKLLL